MPLIEKINYYRELKNIKMIHKISLIIIVTIISIFSSIAQDCGPSRLIDNGGESDWIDYNSDDPASNNDTWYECEERVFVNGGSSEIIYVDYPYQTGAVELSDTLGNILVIFPWHITPEIAEEYNYTGEIPNPEDIYVHANPANPEEECPTKNYYEVRYRKNSSGQLQYKWRYTESEYYLIPDPFTGTTNIANGECLRLGDGETFTPSQGTRFTRIYDGKCNNALDTNGDTFIVSGAIISYGGGELKGNEFRPKEKNWELIFTGSLEKRNGQFADFVVEQIK